MGPHPARTVTTNLKQLCKKFLAIVGRSLAFKVWQPQMSVALIVLIKFYQIMTANSLSAKTHSSLYLIVRQSGG